MVQAASGGYQSQRDSCQAREVCSRIFAGCGSVPIHSNAISSALTWRDACFSHTTVNMEGAEDQLRGADGKKSGLLGRWSVPIIAA